MPHANDKGAGKPAHLCIFVAYNSSADGAVAPLRAKVQVTHRSRSQAFHQY